MPRVVCVASRPGAIRSGPSDRRMYVVDAIRKRPYRDPATGVYNWPPPSPKSPTRARAPGWPAGRRPSPKSLPRERPVRPSRRGNFDYLKPGTRPFSAATAYASARCALEVWEYYLGRRISLVGRTRQRKLEIIPRLTALGDNAWSGEWYIELGFADR